MLAGLRCVQWRLGPIPLPLRRSALAFPRPIALPAQRPLKLLRPISNVTRDNGLSSLPARGVLPSRAKDDDDLFAMVAEQREASTSIDAPNISRIRFKMPHTVLIDASPIVHGAYHRVDFLTAPDGTPVNAVFGFMRTLLKIMKDFDYDYIVVCMDSGSSFRKQVYPAYKANRSVYNDDLLSQLQLIEPAAAALGILAVKKEGYEADDIIATYTRVAQESGHKVTIISPDKDFGQLVDANVDLVSYKTKEVTKLGVDEINKLWSIAHPRQLAHVQAICGDKIDNIPSVTGLGPVRAAALVAQFGSIENMLLNRHQVEEKYRELINAHAGILERNIQLTKLVDNIPDLPPLSALERKLPDQYTSLSFLYRYGFKSILNLVNTKWFGQKPDYIPSDFENTSVNSRVEEKFHEPVFPRCEINDTMSAAEIRDLLHVNCPGVTIVNDQESANKAIEVLYKFKNRYHACDTEVIDLDIIEDSPISAGTVICATIYCGPDVDFGNGPRLFIDNLDRFAGTLERFKEYFEDEEVKKVWHNYGFDRHILYRHGIDVKGFGGDTMHMARLWDASRSGRGEYSLESLSAEILQARIKKRGLKKRFGVQKTKKDGSLYKDSSLPALEELQRSPDTILAWIDYSTLDADATWFLREALHKKLERMEWEPNVSTMWDFYQLYWAPFGELLTDMERAGIYINKEHLNSMLPKAYSDKEGHEKRFIEWATSICPPCKDMNPTSDTQKQQLLFAPCKNQKTGEDMPAQRVFKVPNDDGFIEEGKKAAKKDKDMVITGVGLEFSELTISGWPSVSGAVLKKMAGNPDSGKFGTAKDLFAKRGFDGEAACRAIDAVVKANAIDTLISGFIAPLPQMTDELSRVHCSLNLNTETGRLSSRRPNLQNQPALEKDTYKIRRAFAAPPGKTLVVADYGQLELRLLAHITECKSMIDAFRSGGDFHSRTAVGMYDHIGQQVKEGKVLVDWDTSKGKPPVPLLKDAFATERRRAKTLNFSIAYGKTVHGFAKDWNVTEAEAQETLEKWYADRPEVRSWQERMIAYAHETGYTRTLLGRYRSLPDINHKEPRKVKHSERAAINTPLQGGAADIMVLAMLKLHRSDRLKSLGWRQLLQIHDELIFEGPEETKVEALHEIKQIMENPLDRPLLVDLVVDAKCEKDWYSAK